MKTASSGSKPRKAHRWMLPVTLLSSLLIAGGAGEIILRVFFHDTFALTDEERTLTYRFDETLGCFPIPNSQRQVTGERTITAIHNSEGFRGPELVKDNKPAIIFLGDS